MANYLIPDIPTFDVNGVRKLEPTDRAHASIFNELFLKLLTNEAFLYNRGTNIEGSLDDKADKSVKIPTTIPASTWTGTAAPFVNRIAVNGLKAVHNVEVTTTENVTNTQIESFAGASIQKGHTEDGYLVLEAYGDKPEIDLPIMIIVRGDISETGIISDNTVISGGTFADWSE